MSVVAHWVRLNVRTLADLHERWRSRPEASKDPLMGQERWPVEPSHPRWVVKSELELVRLLGALQWFNPDLALWFRGEGRFFASAPPARYRRDDDPLPALLRWFTAHAARDRALRDRSPLERVALLQHYGCPTSMLDLSANLDVSCAFAAEGEEPHVRVYALPRHTRAISDFFELDTVLVDLRAALPSYFMRPHLQFAAFMGRRSATLSDTAGGPCLADREAAMLDDLCVGHVRLAFDARKRFYHPRLEARTLYPPPSSGCNVCSSTEMSGDFGLHFLRCLGDKVEAPPESFPDRYADAAAARRREIFGSE